MLGNFLSGGIWIACWAIAYFFLRFAKQRRDSLFYRFSLAFFLLGVERIVLVFVGTGNEFHAYIYLIRLFAFGLIIAGIIAKNFSDASTKE